MGPKQKYIFKTSYTKEKVDKILSEAGYKLNEFNRRLFVQLANMYIKEHMKGIGDYCWVQAMQDAREKDFENYPFVEERN